MYDGIHSHLKHIRYKVVFNSRVDLYDVTTLASDIEIVDCETLKVSWTRANCKGVGPREREEKVSE